MVPVREIYVNGRLRTYSQSAELELILQREKRCAERRKTHAERKPRDKQKLA